MSAKKFLKGRLIQSSSIEDLRERFAKWFLQFQKSVRILGYQYFHAITVTGVPVYVLLVKYEVREVNSVGTEVFFEIFPRCGEDGSSTEYNNWLNARLEDIESAEPFMSVAISPSSSGMFGGGVDIDLFVIWQRKLPFAPHQAREHFESWLKPSEEAPLLP